MGMTTLASYKAKRGQAGLRSVWQNPWHFLACGLGVGTFPYMPGTVGTLLGVVVYLLLAKCHFITYVILELLLLSVGVYLCGRFNREVGTDDHPAAVWDEVASFPMVMLGIPQTAGYVVLGFILFRVLDIWKPWPISWVDRRIHGGVGVMLDDVLAALLSWIILYTVVYVVR